MTDEQKAIIRRAADWLEAHPDKHIKGYFAMDDRGHVVHPTQPEAECFCAVGRIMKEADLKYSEGTGAFRDVKDALGIDSRLVSEVWRTNDSILYFKSRLTEGGGNPTVIALLRKIAA